MDFVADVEDEFDILITMNMQAEIETVGQLVDAVETLRADAMSARARRRPARRNAPTAPDLFSKFDAADRPAPGLARHRRQGSRSGW